LSYRVEITEREPIRTEKLKRAISGKRGKTRNLCQMQQNTDSTCAKCSKIPTQPVPNRGINATIASRKKNATGAK